MNHEEVFGDLHKELFTLSEAAEYLEMEEGHLYDDYVREYIDAELMFTYSGLKQYKQHLHSLEGETL